MDTSLKERICGFVDHVHEHVTMPNMMQGRGTWYENTDDIEYESYECCFGARVAFAFGINKSLHGEKEYDYTDGINRMQNELDLDHVQLEFVLWASGSHFDPFGVNNWPTIPDDVMDNLVQIEWIPNRNLCGALRNSSRAKGKIKKIYKQLCKPVFNKKKQGQLMGQYI